MPEIVATTGGPVVDQLIGYSLAYLSHQNIRLSVLLRARDAEILRLEGELARLRRELEVATGTSWADAELNR